MDAIFLVYLFRILSDIVLNFSLYTFIIIESYNYHVSHLWCLDTHNYKKIRIIHRRKTLLWTYDNNKKTLISQYELNPRINVREIP